MDRHIVDAMLEIATADELRTVFDAPPPHTRLDLLKEIVNYPYTIPGLSDGGARAKFFCGGRYPTEFLTSFTRDQGMLSLEAAHWKLSAWPAICAGVLDRGVLCEGYAADTSCTITTVWESNRVGGARSSWRRVAARATCPRLPLHHGQRRSDLVDGQPTELTPGLLLRHGSGRNKPQIRRAI